MLQMSVTLAHEVWACGSHQEAQIHSHEAATEAVPGPYFHLRINFEGTHVLCTFGHVKYEW